MVATAPYGSWRSPISPAMLTQTAIGLEGVTADGADLYWIESRPTEAGRSVVVRRRPDGMIDDASPAGFDARTRVHEYGGGAYAVSSGVVIASSFQDQRVYRLEHGEAHPITPEPAQPAGDRYADFSVHRDQVFCVRERHRTEAEPANELVTFPMDGSGPPRVIAGGHDFVSSPRVSPDGSRLTWLTWDHPNMPWDGTDLWVGDLDSDGAVHNPNRVAGGVEESIFQPEWAPDGTLHFASDRTGWWNLYRVGVSGEHAPLCSMEAEFGTPQWQFGYRRYGFLASGQVAAVLETHGVSSIGIIEAGRMRTLQTERDVISNTLAVTGGRLWTVAAGAINPAAVIGVDPGTGEETVVRSSQSIDLHDGYASRPEPISFATTGDAVAHAVYYPPANVDFTAPDDELPPLVVWSHGGPTGSTSRAFRMGLQFWTSRGFAVVDVNYRGSAGYGRAYRNSLRGEWGVVDTEDCIAAARHLADEGLIDADRMAIRGGSAGGYTTLCALTFHNDFATGTSHFGVGDLEALARDTHKFESRYLDSLVGPYPQARDLYRERSPMHHTDLLSRPMLILQGLEDRVVLPDQAEMMAGALDQKGIPYAYLAFEGEGHGFRKAETLERVAEAELLFYGWVFGFEPAGDLKPLEIHNG